MAAWTSDELSTIGTAEELEIQTVRQDGTLRNPVTIWVVRHGDDLYVRSVNGRTGALQQPVGFGGVALVKGGFPTWSLTVARR